MQMKLSRFLQPWEKEGKIFGSFFAWRGVVAQLLTPTDFSFPRCFSVSRASGSMFKKNSGLWNDIVFHHKFHFENNVPPLFPAPSIKLPAKQGVEKKLPLPTIILDRKAPPKLFKES